MTLVVSLAVVLTVLLDRLFEGEWCAPDPGSCLAVAVPASLVDVWFLLWYFGGLGP